MDVKIGLICVLCMAGFIGAVRAESFALNDGMEFEGQIIQGTANSVIIRSDSGSLIPLAYNKIATVRVTVDGGEVIEGGLLSWNAGVYTLRVGERIVGVQNGRIASVLGPTIQPIEPAFSDTGIGGAPEPSPTPAPVPPAEPAAPPAVVETPPPPVQSTARPRPTM